MMLLTCHVLGTSTRCLCFGVDFEACSCGCHDRYKRSWCGDFMDTPLWRCQATLSFPSVTLNDHVDPRALKKMKNQRKMVPILLLWTSESAELLLFNPRTASDLGFFRVFDPEGSA
eukprot:5622932-Amphidinium_carterae.2